MNKALKCALFFLCTYKVIDLSRNILYTWQVVGEGGIYIIASYHYILCVNINLHISLTLFVCVAKMSHNLKLYWAGPPHGEGPPPTQTPDSGWAHPEQAIEVPGSGPTSLGGPTPSPLNRK